MGFYSQVIFPRLCDFLLDRPLVARHRRGLLAHVRRLLAVVLVVAAFKLLSR